MASLYWLSGSHVVCAPLDQYVARDIGRYVDQLVNRYVDRQSADTLTIEYRRNIDQLSVVYQSTVGGLSVDCLIIYHKSKV